MTCSHRTNLNRSPLNERHRYEVQKATPPDRRPVTRSDAVLFMNSIRKPPDSGADPDKPAESQFSSSRQQAVVMAIIAELIVSEVVDYTEADGKRWWHLNARIISRHAPKDSCASYPPTVRWLLRSLERTGQIEIRYFVFNLGCRMTICPQSMAPD